jgi:hypothetical protein
MKNINEEIKRFKDLTNHERGRVISEQKKVDNLIRSVLNEASFLPCIQDGEGLCKIKCRIKQAKKGCPKSKEVKEIQHALAKLGYFEGEGGGMSKECATNVEACDGIFDWRTKKAVEDFQTDKGLTKDGAVGEQTITALINPTCECQKETTTGGEQGGSGGRDGTITDSECQRYKDCISKHIKQGVPDIPNLLKCLGLDEFVEQQGGDKIEQLPSYCVIDCQPKPADNVELQNLKKICCGSKDFKSEGCKSLIKYFLKDLAGCPNVKFVY